MFLDTQAPTNSADPDQMPQNAASDQNLLCLPSSNIFLNTTRDSKMGLFKLQARNVRSLFVRVEVLRPSQPIKVMLNMVSWPTHTVPGQA